MTSTQKTIIATVVAVGAILFGVFQSREASNLRTQVSDLRREQQGQAVALSNEVRELQAERDRARTELAAITATQTKTKETNEALKLRGEVSRLRSEKNELGSTSGLSKATANPEVRKLMREQQKMGMKMIYGEFAKSAKLTDEQNAKLQDVLADHIMDNVENVTIALREKMTTEKMTELFGAQETALQGKVRELLGDDGFAQYQEYTKDLLSSISAEQFKSMITGDGAAKDQKAREISQILRQESQAALAKEGLPADSQLIPMLNFRNIASESEGERSLKLLDGIYSRAAERLGTILDKDELAKFEEFRTKAINNNRAALSMNRSLMAPIGN